MLKFNPVHYIVTSVEIGGGKAVVELKGARATVTYELAEDSGWLKYLTEGAAVTETVEVTQLGAPAPDEVYTVSGAPTTTVQEKGEYKDQGEPTAEEARNLLATTKQFITPASDVPPPVVDAAHPAVATRGMPVAGDINSVKEMLGII